VNNDPISWVDERGLSASDNQKKKAEEFASILRGNVGKTYEAVGECNGSILNPLRQMGYAIPQGYNADAIAKGKIPGITVLPDVKESRQGVPGIVNGYDWNKDGKIDHVNAGVGQRTGETKSQVFDATENTIKKDGSDGINETWTKGRNAGSPSNGQTTTATSGQANLTFVPFSSSSKPAVQLQIDFNVLNQNFGSK
jgi:hypothetical protein